MLLQITAQPDPRLLATAMRRGLRHPFLIARVIGWSAIGTALLLDAGTGQLSMTMLLTGLLLAVGVPMFLTNAGVRQAMEDDVTTYEITGGGVARSTPASRHAYAWNAFRYVEQRPGQLILGRGGLRVVPVPTAGLSPAQIEQVLATAAGHGIPVRRFTPRRYGLS